MCLYIPAIGAQLWVYNFCYTSQFICHCQPSTFITSTRACINVCINGSYVSRQVAWLLNLVTGLFKGKIKTAVQGAVAGAVSKAVTGKLDDALAKLPLSVHFGGGKSRVRIDTRCTDLTVRAGTAPVLGVGNVFSVNNAVMNTTCDAAVSRVPHLPLVAPSTQGGERGDRGGTGSSNTTKPAMLQVGGELHNNYFIGLKYTDGCLSLTLHIHSFIHPFSTYIGTVR